jgi:hypothetical protein
MRKGKKMAAEAWNYYLSHASLDDDPERNGIIFRHRPGDPDSEGQVYVSQGWIRSTTLLDIAYGHDHREVIPVTEEKARQLMNSWILAGRFSKIPDEWE